MMRFNLIVCEECRGPLDGAVFHAGNKAMEALRVQRCKICFDGYAQALGMSAEREAFLKETLRVREHELNEMRGILRAQCLRTNAIESVSLLRDFESEILREKKTARRANPRSKKVKV